MGWWVMSEVDKSVTPVAVDLLGCLQAEIAKVAKPPATVGLRTGAQVELLLSTRYDECCAGTAWVRVSSVYPSAQFPSPDEGYVPCWPIQWAAVLEMGAVRCAPTPSADEIPSEDQWNNVSTAVQDDAAAMRRALCCWVDQQGDRMFVPGPWVPQTTEGGCVGGIMTVTVQIGACDC